MNESFQILIDRLKDGQVQKIVESYDPSFLEIQEKELCFNEPVKVVGEAYVTEDELILHMSASTRVIMPCAICNEMTQIELEIKNFYHAQPIGEIVGAIFDLRETLREALLIELPPFAECKQGKCPQRSTIAPYLRTKQREEKPYFPFADLN